MYLFRQEHPDPAIRHRFDLVAGWRYGLILGVALVAVGWGRDAWLLYSASVEFAWAKLALAVLLLLPGTIAAATLAARAYESPLLKWLVWGIWGILLGLIAGYLPFTGLRLVAGALDPSVRGLPLFPDTSESQFLAGFIAFGGALAGLPGALLEIFALGNAWDSSTADNRLSLRSWAFLSISLAPALVLGLACDYFTNATLRASPLLLNDVIQFTLHAPPNLDVGELPQDQLLKYIAGASWRERMTAHYTQHRADLDPATFQQMTLDVEFDNGFIWRCQTSQYGRYVGGCFDLSSEYHDAVAEFLQTGRARCLDCTIQVDPQAAEWQAAHQAQLTSPPPIAIFHRTGSVVLVNSDLNRGFRVQCRLVGANPVQIMDCTGP